VTEPQRIASKNPKMKMIKKQGILHVGIFNFRSLAFILMSAFFHCFSLSTSAQEISAKASSPKTEYLVGDKISILLDLKMPQGFSSAWQKHEPEPSQLETLDSSGSDSSTDGHFKNIKIHVTVAGYDSGEAVYPAQEFVFRKTGDNKPFIIKSQPIIFHIKTITVDTNKDIKPIVDPVNPGWDLLKIIEYVLLYLVFAGVVLLIYLVWRRSKGGKKTGMAQATNVQHPPWETAMEKLALLEQQKLPEKGQVKTHYIELSEIIRNYLAAIFRMDTLELTTDEILKNLQGISVTRETISHIANLLNISDSVKFAKYHPDGSDNQKAMAEAVEIVESLRSGGQE
jgi:hypothetical protein